MGLGKLDESKIGTNVFADHNYPVKKQWTLGKKKVILFEEQEIEFLCYHFAPECETKII